MFVIHPSYDLLFSAVSMCAQGLIVRTYHVLNNASKQNTVSENLLDIPSPLARWTGHQERGPGQ